MLENKFYYLVHLQFLGFRYHGWQKQPQVKTIQHMLDRTLITVLGHDNFKTLGASRTDAMVSANHHCCEIFANEKIDPEYLQKSLNLNLPQDIKVSSIEEVDKDFKVINNAKVKEYLYFFCYGEKFHPFCAPFMCHVHEELDIPLMQKGAKIFEGQHNFKLYSHRANENKNFERTISQSQIEINDYFTGSFFPKESYVLKIKGEGFLRQQVRLMAGTLLKLGLGEITIEDITKSLDGEGDYPIGFIAPASGLVLNKTEFL